MVVQVQKKVLSTCSDLLIYITNKKIRQQDENYNLFQRIKFVYDNMISELTTTYLITKSSYMFNTFKSTEYLTIWVIKKNHNLGVD